MKSPKRDATSVSRVSTWASPHTARRSAIRLLCTVAVLAVLLPGHGLVAQTAVELLDKAMKLQIAQTSFSGTASARRLTVTLIRQEGKETGESRYDITSQFYRHIDMRIGPTGDSAVKMDLQSGLGPNSYESSSHQILIKLNGAIRLGTVNGQGRNLVINSIAPNTFPDLFRFLLTGYSSEQNLTEDIIYRYWLPDSIGLGNRAWGLQQATIKRIETLPDGTKAYCISAKLANGLPVLVLINSSDFRVMRVIQLRDKYVPYGTLESGYVTTSIDFTETVYACETPSSPAEDDLARFQTPAIDFTLPANRARFLDIMDIVGLFSDRCEHPAPSPGLQPGSNANKLWSEKLSRGIIVVETDKGPVSGFMAKINGSYFVVTNLHVIGPDKKIILKTTTGTVVPYTAIYGAAGRDIALLRVTRTDGALNLAQDVTKAVKTGQRIVLIDNEQGGGLAHENSNTGRLLDIGPDRIETAGIFRQDNSSCPNQSGGAIISGTSGEVLGVATYVKPESVDLNEWFHSIFSVRTFSPPPHWFGFRLDGTIQWQLIELSKWQSQRRLIDTFRELSDALASAMKGRFQDIKKQPRLLSIVEGYKTVAAAHFGKDSTSYLAEITAFTRNLRALAEEDVQSIKSADFYDYYRTCLYWEDNIPDQLEYRAAIIRVLKNYEENPLLFEKQLRKK